MASLLLKRNNQKAVNCLLYYILPFTAAFLLLQFIVYYPFTESGKSFIWGMDGINQHFPALAYYGRLLKELFAGKGIPLVDFNIGMGFDTLTTLNYYAIGDPLTLLAAFAGEENMEEMYRFLILLRLYLSGVSFIVYCIYLEKKAYPAVLGGLIYVFCGYSFYAAVRHPYFTNPLIYLPLLLTGLEMVLQKKKPYLFILMTCISALSNFYFFYMLTILIILYAVIRFFYCNKSADAAGDLWILFFKTAWRTGFYYILGAAMAAVILLPVLAAFFNNGRFGSGYYVNLLYYAPGFYVVLANSFIAANVTPGYWTQCTFAAIVPVAVLVTFRNRKYRELMFGFMIVTVCLMIPYTGYLMNGFAYVCNRWIFGYSFLVAFIFVAVYEDMFRLSGTDRILLLAGTGIYGVLGLLNVNKYVLYAYLILCVTVICILFFNMRNNLIFLQRTVIFILVFLNLGINGYLTYSGRYGNYADEFIDSGKAWEAVYNPAVSLIPGIPDDSFYRVEVFGNKQLNEALTVGFHDVSGYYSIMDKRITEYMKGLELVSQRAAFRFDNLDYRTGIGTLAGVKYVVTPYKAVAPYGYTLFSEHRAGGRTYYVFENQFALPLGYIYDQYITRDIYESLNGLQKQEVMLQAMVLEESLEGYPGIIKDRNSMGRAMGNSINFVSRELPVSFELGRGISWEGDYLNVTEPGARLTVYFESMKNSETYLRLENFDINETDYYAMNIKVKGEREVTKTVNVRSQRNNAYFGKDDYLINLGYQAEVMEYCVISFGGTGKFHLSDIQVYALPMSNYDKQAAERKDGAMENIKTDNNRITGTVNLEKDSLLCLSIPYSKGWSAYVDGVRTELLQANVMYMALPLKSGRNDIKLIYETPYLKAGSAVSAAGWFLFFSIIIFNRITNAPKIAAQHTAK